MDLNFITIFLTINTIFILGVKSDYFLQTCCNLDLRQGKNTCDETNNKQLKTNQKSSWEIPAHLVLNGLPITATLRKSSLLCATSNKYTEYDIGDAEAPDLEFHNDGYLRLGSDIYAEYIHPSKYCIHGITQTQFKMKYCEAECTKTEPCIQKCCPLHKVFNLESEGRRCVDDFSHTMLWSPKLLENLNDEKSLIKLDDKVKPRYLIRAPPVWQDMCPLIDEHRFVNLFPYSLKLGIKFDLQEFSLFKGHFSSTGQLYHESAPNNWIPYNNSSYCTDGLVIKSTIYNDTLDETFFLKCEEVVTTGTDVVFNGSNKIFSFYNTGIHFYCIYLLYKTVLG